MNKEKGWFFVRGRFEVYDGKGVLRTRDHYINEYISAVFDSLARRIGILKAQERAVRRYGTGSRIREIEKTTAKPASREKCREKEKKILKKMVKRDQGKLF